MKKGALAAVALSFASAISVITIAVAKGADCATSTYQASPVYSIAIVQDAVSISNDQNDALTVSELNELPVSELQSYDFIIFNERSLSGLMKETAETFLQSGGVLGVETSNTDTALSAIYAKVDVEKPVTIDTSGGEEIGAYVTMRNGKLVPGIISQSVTSLPNEADVSPASEQPNSNALGLCDKISVDNFLSHNDALRKANTPTSWNP